MGPIDDRYPTSFFRPVSEVKKPENVDWSQLPVQYQHLIPIFETYGYLQFDNIIFQKLQSMTEAELKEVNEIYKSLTPLSDKLFGSFIDKIGITKSEAAALAYFALYFFEIAKYHGFISGE